MPTKTWYINPATRAKVTLAAGNATTDIHVLTQEDNGSPRAKAFKSTGQAISAAEATAANAAQDASAVPAAAGAQAPVGQSAAIANVPASGAAYVQAEQSAQATAINSILAALRANGIIAP